MGGSRELCVAVYVGGSREFFVSTNQCSTPQTSNKELLTVMDENGSMWQISIDGSKVKVANSTPAQVSTSVPIYM